MEIVYYVAASLDGFIATPEGGIEWLRPFEGGAEDYGYAEFYASVEAVLLGRKTYEQCLQFPEWPYAGKPYWVFSRATGNTPAKVVAEMRGRGLRRAWLVGGGKLAAAFCAEGLVTEYIVSVTGPAGGRHSPLRRARRQAGPSPRRDEDLPQRHRAAALPSRKGVRANFLK